jgi:hypothetical protein
MFKSEIFPIFQGVCILSNNYLINKLDIPYSHLVFSRPAKFINKTMNIMINMTNNISLPRQRGGIFVAKTFALASVHKKILN